MRLKKVKDAKERVKASEYYVSTPSEYKGKWNEFFKNNNPIHIEIGMGKGNFVIGMAKAHKDINYIGIEMYDSVMVKAVEKLKQEEKPLKNLKLVLIDAMKIDEIFENEISRIYLNFSDPWPKAKHEKRRLTSKIFLEKYDKIFKGQKQIFQKTDNNDLFDFSMVSLVENGYELRNVTRDLHAENVSDNIMTEYEEKFSNAGIKINRLEAYKD